MKRLWKWLLNLLPYDEKYVFRRGDTRVDGCRRISIEFYQDVYRRRRLWRTERWRGVILVRVILDGVRFYTQGRKSTTSSLHGTQEYTLRCDNDYVEILKHLAALEVRGMLTPAERSRVVVWQETIMLMWPPGSSCNIHDPKKECDSELIR